MDSKLRCVFAMPAGQVKSINQEAISISVYLQEQNNTEDPKFDISRNQVSASPAAPVKVIFLLNSKMYVSKMSAIPWNEIIF